MVECGWYLASGESESRDNKGEIPPLTQLRHVPIIWVIASQSEALMGGKNGQSEDHKVVGHWAIAILLSYCQRQWNVNRETLFTCLNFNPIIRPWDSGRGRGWSVVTIRGWLLNQSISDFNWLILTKCPLWEALSPPAFYLLYWQPLICNIAKILNRHRWYLDPRSPGTRTRPLSVTIILITDQVPSLPAIFRSFMCQILFRPRTFIKYFCQWNSKTFPPPHLKQSSIGESRIIASQKVRKVGINSTIFRFEMMWGSQGNKILW